MIQSKKQLMLSYRSTIRSQSLSIERNPELSTHRNRKALNDKSSCAAVHSNTNSFKRKSEMVKRSRQSAQKKVSFTLSTTTSKAEHQHNDNDSDGSIQD